MHNSNSIDTPINKGNALSAKIYPKTPEKEEQMSRVSYVSAVGSPMYAILCTRPDICFAIDLVS